MAKILITSLGTGTKKEGTYRKANYEIEKTVYSDETFIAKALTKHYGIEKIFMVGTSGSMWDEVYSVYGGENSDKTLELYEKKETDSIIYNDLAEVSSAIDSYLNSEGSKCFLVSYGLNDNELWSNFEQYLKMSEYINDGDEIYLDITHSFRSLAIMSFLMTQFIEQVRQKDIRLGGIFYGMWEYSGQNNNITPVVDMSILAEIQEWTKAVGYLKYFGNATMLYELISNNCAFHTDKDTKNVFMHLSNNISMGNITGIYEAVQTVKRRISILETSSNPVAAYLSKDIKEFVSSLDYEKETDFSLALAKWFMANRNYGMSYLVLYDFVIAKICELNGLNPDNKEDQEQAKNIIYKLAHSPDRRLSVFYETVKNIRKIRHSIAHSTGRSGASVSDINNLPEYLRKIEAAFKVLKGNIS